jgi:hypothetical protein
MTTPLLSIDRLKDLSEKFVIKADGCWEWQGNTNSSGYGRLGINNKVYQAHRVMYTQINGQIPTGQVIDHLCRKRDCINPSHLEPVSIGENVKRGNPGSNHVNNAQRAKTHCPKGHKYTVKNIYWQRDTKCLSGYSRKCKICTLERVNARYRNV